MKYVASGSPQIKSSATTKRIMIDVVIALLPACIVGCILLGLQTPKTATLNYGLSSAIILIVATLSAVVAEFVFRLCTKATFKQIVDEFDFTSVVTGLLIGMNMYATSKWYAAMLASVFAVVVVKMLFGGTGKNIVNPAIAGRIFAFIAFGQAFGGSYASDQKVQSPLSYGFFQTGSTPLQAVVNPGAVTDNSLNALDLFLGTGVQGCIGEISKAALLVGGIYLIIRGVLDFRWPLVYILVTGVVTVLVNWFAGMASYENFVSTFIGVEFEKAIKFFVPSMLSGGLFLGAIFMATDYVTTPVNKLGKYIYFALLGILTAVLRHFTKMEVVSFVILLGNLIVPLIDTYIVRRPFGYHKIPKEVK